MQTSPISKLKKPTVFSETSVSPQKVSESPQKVSDSPSKAFSPSKLSGLMGEALVAKAGLDIALNKSAKMYSPTLI